MPHKLEVFGASMVLEAGLVRVQMRVSLAPLITCGRKTGSGSGERSCGGDKRWEVRAAGSSGWLSIQYSLENAASQYRWVYVKARLNAECWRGRRL